MNELVDKTIEEARGHLGHRREPAHLPLRAVPAAWLGLGLGG